MSLPDLDALWLTLQLGVVTTVLLLLIGTPLAWWLARTRTRLKPAIEAVVALPLVLPPTVLGFYLLLAFNPSSPIGSFWITLTGDTLIFSFAGLVIASVLYSLPFTVQPLQAAFENVAGEMMEAAASLRASPLDAFFSVAVPLSVRGFLTAAVLSFAHTLGEFGVVLMVGGNIPGETRVLSIAIYEHVETLNYDEAHALSLLLLLFSFCVLLFVYVFNRRYRVHAH
ncbi:molybdate ABC transporter permease subunit [Parvularcula marina]|uniref:Molybdenum transport system permease n=1 Tax=Parvularcula marina TaxID=2292771 RepID=A0A371RI48_9PROT|nr:molybdate ABC transporter permease subunit [Parvularcula marina]RFB05134.1 molybdate ABC transporter permease subunit [Parvularcula marina]